jgi:predicted GIY-YIG superfamily endonuclease
MPDYSKNKIYELVSDNLPGIVYVGHTTDPIEKRLERHERLMDCTARRIIEAGSYHIRVLEEWPCDTREQALWRERWWIENIPCINEVIPIRTEEEWKEYGKRWSRENAVSRRNAVKKWKKANRAKVNEIKRISAQRPAVKAKIKEHRSERVQCLMCGAFGGRGDKSTHTRACYTRFCKAFDIDADFKGVRGVTSE